MYPSVILKMTHPDQWRAFTKLELLTEQAGGAGQACLLIKALYSRGGGQRGSTGGSHNTTLSLYLTYSTNLFLIFHLGLLWLPKNYVVPENEDYRTNSVSYRL